MERPVLCHAGGTEGVREALATDEADGFRLYIVAEGAGGAWSPDPHVRGIFHLAGLVIAKTSTRQDTPATRIIHE